MEKLSKLIFYTINLPVYLVSVILPKKKNVWVFGSWFGEKYADNSRYLFEYVCENHPEIKAVWLSKNASTINKILEKGFDATFTYGWRGYYLSMICNVGVVSTGNYDLNVYAFAGKSKMVNLWHGTALKKIMYDDKITFKPDSKAAVVFPFLGKTNYGLITAPSMEVKNKFVGAFRSNESKVGVTGNPRNDAFSIIEPVAEKASLKGVYMPTHRGEGSVGFMDKLVLWAKELDPFLVEKGVTIYVKLHFYHRQEIEGLTHSFKQIKFIGDEEFGDDFYPFLATMDFLITDYSSIFFDYLIANKPVIFFPYDKEEYLTSDRELYYDYDDVTPGPKVLNVDQLRMEIGNIVEGVDEYKLVRKKVNSMFNDFFDGKNSERVFNAILKMDSRKD
jgi:CDP-glycerol glycerophosphotransferase (TagB/SpsB family)